MLPSKRKRLSFDGDLMINISLKCFHEVDPFEDSEAHAMTPTFLWVIRTIKFKCPVCEREVILKITEGASEPKKY